MGTDRATASQALDARTHGDGRALSVFRHKPQIGVTVETTLDPMDIATAEAAVRVPIEWRAAALLGPVAIAIAVVALSVAGRDGLALEEILRAGYDGSTR